MFLDYSSLFQKPRSVQQDVAFYHALSQMQIWYAHTRVTVLLCSEDVVGYENVAPYTERGWTNVECAWASLAKVNEWIIWPMVVEVADTLSRRRLRLVPRVPSAMDDILLQKRFTSGSDLPVVRNLYRSTLETVCKELTRLELNDRGLNDEDAANIATLIAICPMLDFVNLAPNPLGPKGLRIIAEVVGKSEAKFETGIHVWASNMAKLVSKEEAASIFKEARPGVKLHFYGEQGIPGCEELLDDERLVFF